MIVNWDDIRVTFVCVTMIANKHEERQVGSVDTWRRIRFGFRMNIIIRRERATEQNRGACSRQAIGM